MPYPPPKRAPGQPPPGVYCPCCNHFRDCCICNDGNARYYGEECKTCLPLSGEKADEPIIVEKT